MLLLFLRALDLFLIILIALIIINAILSWFPVNRSSKPVKLLRVLIDPILTPIRKLIQKSIFGGSNMALDFSPFIAYLILTTLHRTLVLYIGSSWLNF